ncbi:la-related protein 4-like [Dendronephthya gigantea]|uniref:la-related protein 4-like n=1 Tax=Dendronephthya gigantea TaxID=151771 RepID=UPI00106CB37A|nr:la-related protein 4-like [Dendronephthya gigantea]
MSSATTSSSEVDIANSKKSPLSPEDQRAQLNPDAAVFETGSVSKDSLKEPETWPDQDRKDDMPSPQVSPNIGVDADIMVNGGEPSVFAEPHIGARQNIPEHIKPDELPKDELRTLVRQQLEYYFSRENLAGDTYLVSQMDSDQYVLIQIVANFNQMKKLTNDIELVKEAIKESAYLQMDDSLTKMRPNVKRCIVILREVPESTSVEEVEELFSGEGCPKYISCEPANNNYWYIHFESEDCAQKAYRYLREDIKTFKGKPIMARIKAKPIPRAASSFVQKNGMRQNNEPSTIPSMPSPAFRYPVSPMYGSQGYSFFQPAVMPPNWAAGQPYFDALIPTMPNNAYHSPQNFKGNNHQGNRPYYQHPFKSRNQTRSHREPDRVDKEVASYGRPRAHSTNGTTNTNTSNSNTSSNNTTTNSGPNKSPSSTISASSLINWRRDDEHRLGPRARRRRGSSEDIRIGRSPIPQEPQRSKDDSHFNLSNAQFPPLPTTNTFKTSDLPLQSPSTRQDYNKVASSPPLSPPITPTSTPRVTESKPKEETKEKTTNETIETPAKKEETKKTETKKVSEPEVNSKDTAKDSANISPKDTAKDNPKTTQNDKTKETSLNESSKLSYAQIAQKKAMQNKQQTNITTVSTVTTNTNTQS